jgi:hypothetical protein
MTSELSMFFQKKRQKYLNYMCVPYVTYITDSSTIME